MDFGPGLAGAFVLDAGLELDEAVEDRHFLHRGPRSFFVQGAATVAIEPDALEAARRMLRAWRAWRNW